MSVPHTLSRRLFCGFALFLLSLGLLGCFGGKEGSDAISSDVHGYFCPKCKHKFYTAADVFADKCPNCGELAIDEVWGHYCTECDALTLAPRSAGNAAVCEGCGKPTTGGIKMPQEADMKKWGAVKADKASVSM